MPIPTPAFNPTFTRSSSAQSHSSSFSSIALTLNKKPVLPSASPASSGVESKTWSGKRVPPFSLDDTDDGKSLNQLCSNGVIPKVADRIAYANSLDVSMDHYNNTPLHLAVFKHDYYLVYLLLLKGADPNLMNISGFRPLDIAMFLKSKDLIHLLLAMGAKPRYTCASLYSSYPPFNSSSIFSIPTSSSMWISPTIDWDFSLPTSFTKPTTLKNPITTSVKLHTLTSSHPYIHLQDCLPSLPSERLFFYVALDYKDLILELLDQDSTLIYSIDSTEATCLIQATKFSRLEILNYFLPLANEDLLLKKDEFQLSALAWACLLGDIELVQSLLKHPTYLDPVKFMTLYSNEYCSAPSFPIPRTISSLAYTPSSSSPSSTSSCPLLLAAYHGETQICELLVSKGLVPKPLHLMIACWMKHVDIVQYFLSLKIIVIPQPFTGWLHKGFQFLHWFLQGYTSLFTSTWLAQTGSSLYASPNLDPMLEIEKCLAIASPESDIIGQETVKSVPTKLALQSAHSTVSTSSSISSIEMKSGSPRAFLPRHPFLSSEADISDFMKVESEDDPSSTNTDSSAHPPLSAPNPKDGTNGSLLVLPILDFIHSQKIAPYGTELDLQLNTMDIQWRQLLKAIRNSEKKKYSVIAFKLSTLVEALCTLLLTPKELYPGYVERALVEWMVTLREKELPPFLKKSQIASGVWPPPEALEHMILASHTVRNMVRGAVAMAQVSGIWPLGRFLASKGPTLETSPQKSALGGTLRFATYLKESKLKQIDALPSPSPVDPFALAQFLAFPLTSLVNLISQFHSSLLCSSSVSSKESSPPEQGERGLNVQAQQIAEAMDQVLQALQPKVAILQCTAQQRDVITKYQSQLTQFSLILPRKTAQLMGKWPPADAASQVHQCLLDATRGLKQLLDYITPLWSAMTKLSEKEKKGRLFRASHMHALLKLWEESASSSSSATSRQLKPEEVKEYWFMQEKWEGLVFNDESEVRGGTLNSLIERITHFQVDDPAFLNVFLMTHHSFTTSSHLMNLLIQRYEIAPPPGLEDEKSFTAFVEYKLLPIKQKVLDVIVFWMNHFFADFLSDEKALIVQLKNFLSNTVIKETPKRVEQITQSLNSQMKQLEVNSDQNAIQGTRPGWTKLMASRVVSKLAENMSVFADIDPMELAQQLTLLESECFRNISNKEWINQIWGRTHEASKTKAPNIQTMINITNGLSKKIAYLILSSDKHSKRLNVIKHCILFAQHCYELKNLNGVTAIFGGLLMGPVRRLDNIWNEFAKKFPKLQVLNEKLSDLVSPKRQYANYRQFVKSVSAPCIPYLGVHITDLTFIEDGNTDFLQDGVSINFEKRRKVATIIEEIAIWQAQAYYSFRKIPEIQDFFKAIPPSQTDQELYQMSLAIAPIEGDDDE